MSNGPRLRQSDFATMNGDRNSQSSDGLIRRSWHAMADVLSPFSSGALASLPKNPQGRREREIRADAIPEGAPDVIRDYNSINTPQSVTLRVPKKIATPIKVEGKVWFANERTWISYLNAAVLLGTLSLALFNASKDPIGRYFAYVYAVISVGILIYGYAVYQHRITLIRKRSAGHFDQILGPIIISICLFVAVLANFILRVREFEREARDSQP